MDTLRILPLARGGSRMARLITMGILLLAGPLAGAQESFYATSGGMFVPLTGPFAFEAAGPDFSMSALLSGGSPFAGDWTVGTVNQVYLLNRAADADVSVNVRGAPLTFSQGFIQFDTLFTVPGPGIHSESFSFTAVLGDTSPLCFTPSSCTNFFGNGTVALDVVPTGIPGVVNILDATYTITNPNPAVPEPSMASLLLLGFAGLAVLGWRRKARTRELG